MDLEAEKKTTLSWGQQKKIHKRKTKQGKGVPVADPVIDPVTGLVTEVKSQGKAIGDRGYPKEFMEDSFIPLSTDTDLSINNAYKFFGFETDEQVEALGLKRLLTRNSQQSNKIYLLNESLFQLLKANAEAVTNPNNTTDSQKLRVINAGVRLFSNEVGRNKKLQLGSPWRISTEGLPFLIPHIQSRVVHIDIIDFALILVSKQPLMYTEFTNEHTKNAIKTLSVGACIIRAIPPTQSLTFPTDYIIPAYIDKPSTEGDMDSDSTLADTCTHPILEAVINGVDWTHFKSVFTKDYYFPAWNGKASLTLHIAKTEKQSLKDLFLSSTCVLNKIKFVIPPIHLLLSPNIAEQGTRKASETSK